MSRTVAKIIDGFIGVATLPLNRRQRDKTISRVAETIGRSSVRTIDTRHGALRLYALRGAGTASAAERFFTDEPETLEWLDVHVKAGQSLWDIGANIGLYSLYAAKAAKADVFAFEPSALNFGLLTEHIALNGLDDFVKPLCVALGPETKIDALHMGEFSAGHASNALGAAQTQFKTFKPVFSQAIPAFRGDDFVKIFGLNAPDHIKLDVDGIEDKILEGMPETLSRVRTLTMEVEGRNAENAAKIEGLLAAAGLKEDPSHRAKGSGRNRLYTR